MMQQRRRSSRCNQATYVSRRAVDNFSWRSWGSWWTWNSCSIPACFTLHTHMHTLERDMWMCWCLYCISQRRWDSPSLLCHLCHPSAPEIGRGEDQKSRWMKIIQVLKLSNMESSPLSARHFSTPGGASEVIPDPPNMTGMFQPRVVSMTYKQKLRSANRNMDVTMTDFCKLNLLSFLC